MFRRSVVPDVENELFPCHPALDPGRMRCCRAPVLLADTVLVWISGPGVLVRGKISVWGWYEISVIPPLFLYRETTDAVSCVKPQA